MMEDPFWKTFTSHFKYLKPKFNKNYLEPPFINVKLRQTITLTPLNSAELKETKPKDWIILKLRIGNLG